MKVMDSAVRRFAALGAALVLAASAGCHNNHAARYRVAGSISGLSASGLVLRNNGGDDLAVRANASSFQFAEPVLSGDSYNVTVATQPDELTCTVAHGSGSNVHAVVTDISIVCSPVTYTIAGTVTGLTTSDLVLQNNGADNLAVAANDATFQFATPVASGGGYSVTVFSQPTGLTCSVSSGAGTNVAADISNIQITCSASAFSVGGTITGLTGSGLVLQNNGDDDLSVAVNSIAFEFETPVADGGAYAVIVLAQPAGQICSVAQGTGVVTTTVTNVALTCADIITYTVTASSGANGSIAPSGAVVVNDGDDLGFVATPDTGYGVDQWLVDGAPVQTGGDVFTLANVSANHTLAVTFTQTTLTPSVSTLALSVNGTPRQITITNTGSIAASNVSVAYPAFPTGTVASSSTCGAVLAAGASCTITITPGSGDTSACMTGTVPSNDTVTVSADEAADTQVVVLILGYGCIYQGGYIFSIDDTTPNTGSIGGKVAALTDQAPAFPNGIIWSSNGNGNTAGDTDFASILGIDESSTTSSPSPTAPAYPPGTPANSACNGSTDGACNSANIVSYYNFNRSSGGSAPTPLSFYAAGSCSATISGYSDWYLPAICEAGFGGPVCGTAIAPTVQNMQSNLVDTSVGNLSGLYWSSTEDSPNPQNTAVIQLFDVGGGSNQLAALKSVAASVRCARALTP